MYYTANSRLSVRIVHGDVSTAATHTEIEEQQDKTGMEIAQNFGGFSCLCGFWECFM